MQTCEIDGKQFGVDESNGEFLVEVGFVDDREITMIRMYVENEMVLQSIIELSVKRQSRVVKIGKEQFSCQHVKIVKIIDMSCINACSTSSVW